MAAASGPAGSLVGQLAKMAGARNYVKAQQMESWNFANPVLDDGDLDVEVANLAERLTAGPPRAYATTKTSCASGL